MVRASIIGGVCAKGRDRIRFDFEFEGVRHRPTRIPPGLCSLVHIVASAFQTVVSVLRSSSRIIRSRMTNFWTLPVIDRREIPGVHPPRRVDRLSRPLGPSARAR